ncbi:MAG: hypothetical protein RR370_01720 [Synergistaceae bacterium]
MDKKKVSRKDDKSICLRVSSIFYDNLSKYLLDHGVKSKKDWIMQAINDKMEREG